MAIFPRRGFTRSLPFCFRVLRALISVMDPVYSVMDQPFPTGCHAGSDRNQWFSCMSSNCWSRIAVIPVAFISARFQNFQRLSATLIIRQIIRRLFCPYFPLQIFLFLGPMAGHRHPEYFQELFLKYSVTTVFLWAFRNTKSRGSAELGHRWRESGIYPIF